MRLLLFAKGGQCSCFGSISGDVVVAKAVDDTAVESQKAGCVSRQCRLGKPNCGIRSGTLNANYIALDQTMRQLEINWVVSHQRCSLRKLGDNSLRGNTTDATPSTTISLK